MLKASLLLHIEWSYTAFIPPHSELNSYDSFMYLLRYKSINQTLYSITCNKFCVRTRWKRSKQEVYWQITDLLIFANEHTPFNACILI